MTAEREFVKRIIPIMGRWQRIMDTDDDRYSMSCAMREIIALVAKDDIDAHAIEKEMAP